MQPVVAIASQLEEASMVAIWEGLAAAAAAAALDKQQRIDVL